MGWVEIRGMSIEARPIFELIIKWVKDQHLI